ncbi:tubulin epsilon [Paragonimus westermani]|uniref:Tubulin epsilon n=1 Tax=Paragonimus westermani TaxID=34504 RepID=A0A5J4NA43_9TREM|nr:tubulin epsilon [Paragonimus westermani]
MDFHFQAVLVDMEEGVVGELFKGPMRTIYDNRFLITDVSGSGNNWAVGNCYYGHQYHEELVDVIRKATELCDCLQCFFLIHSLGGGTGSGVGTHLLQILAEDYPHVCRIVTAVFPSMEDDVITSPYNTVLGLGQLTESADCVLPIDNSALANIVDRLKEAGVKQVSRSHTISEKAKSNWPAATLSKTIATKTKPFDDMNNIVATMLLNLTRIDQVFSDAFTRDLQLFSADPCRSTYLAAALLMRGSVTASDIRRNIEKLRQRLRFVPWNREGWKVGHCLVPPIGLPYCLLALSNNTAIRERFSGILERFSKLYKRKAHLHHYTSVGNFDPDLFKVSSDSLEDLYQQYDHLERQSELGIMPTLPRLQISD